MKLELFPVGTVIGKWTITGKAPDSYKVQCQCGYTSTKNKNTLQSTKFKIEDGQIEPPGCSNCDPSKLSQKREKLLQEEVVNWCIQNKITYPLLGGYYAIQASKSTPGFRPGMPDLGFFGSNLFVELKVDKNVLQGNQVGIHEEMRKLGCHVVTAYSLEDAIDKITHYVSAHQKAS